MNEETALLAKEPGWRNQRPQPTLPEVYRSMKIPKTGSWIRKFIAFAGPGYLVAVGYMDPGNWATDLSRWFHVWLYAFVGDFAFKLNGYSAASISREAGYRHRTGFGAGLSRSLQQAGFDGFMGALRAGYCRL